MPAPKEPARPARVPQPGTREPVKPPAHRRPSVGWLALLMLLGAAPAPAQPPALEAVAAGLEIDPGSITLSGISSGAFMAQQFHVAHSASVRGVALIAGGPYRCAAGSYPPFSWMDVTGLYAATSVCSNTNPLWFYQGPPDAGFSIRETRREAEAGTIDDVGGLAGDRVWLLSGSEDDTVPRGVVEALERYYRAFLDGGPLHHERLAGAGHAMVTDDFGNACDVSESPFISDCDYDAAKHLLTHLYGPLRPPAAGVEPAAGFDQSAFFDAGDESLSMSPVAYLYVPAACRAGGRCRLHVALHGCQQYQARIGDAFHARAGYNEWAESNRIVVLYPQTTGWSPLFTFGKARNPKGCWDWWGYTGGDHHTRRAPQIKALAAMINVLLGTPLLR